MNPIDLLYFKKISQHENFSHFNVVVFLCKIAFHGILILRLKQNYEFQDVNFVAF